MATINFGVGVSNAFDLLEDETDETRQQTRTSGRTPAKTVAQTTQPKGRAQDQKNEGTASGQRGGRQDNQRNQRGPRDNQRNDRETPNRRGHLVGEGPEPVAESAPHDPTNEGFEKVESTRHHDRKSAGRKEGFVPGGKFRRVYDRKSGTGRGKEVAKGGAGRGNWGSDRESHLPANIENQVEEPEGAEQEPAPPRELTPQEKEELEKEEKRRLEAEQEAKQILLEEYLEEKKKKLAALSSLPPPRSANEGSQSNQWKDFVPLKKEEPQSIKLATVKKDKKKEEKKGEEKKEEKKDKKEKVSDELLGFSAPARNPIPDRREGREGRGERRGGKERRNTGPRKGGQPRGTPQAADTKAIPVHDQEQFPSLAAKA